eukprot:TRINITY_DN20479_c0_g1_i2.p1 TRINITY_DN20479_c0_g1~~TRINITY_DN20479_c0_g1_i2.p1  ORF type:complete len:582 (+),score=106.34 TRINITY_DN20479_c0_g1_i2:36-1781(+)
MALRLVWLLLASRATEVLSAATTSASAECFATDGNAPSSFRCKLNLGGDKLSNSADAFASFEDSIQKTGWARLHVRGFQRPNAFGASKGDDALRMAFAAGFVEGALTAERTWQHRLSYFGATFEDSYNPKGILWKRAVDFVEANDAYVSDKIQQFSASDPYWREVALVWSQLDGLVAGHRSVCKADRCLERRDFLLMSAEQDLSNVIHKPFAADEWTLQTAASYTQKNTHCSSIVRVLPGGTDLVMGHNTWTGFYSMLRVLKEYDLPLPGARAAVVTFASYFGTLYSGDDFYTLSSGLTVQETTNAVYNQTTLGLITPKCILTWARSIVANRQAYDGGSWARWFSPENSGTINNQWMIIASKLFRAGSALPDGLLTVVEQMPGKIVWADETATLRKQGWWASYNSPYFKEIRIVSGADDMERRLGDAYSYDKNPRAKIFHRDAPKADNESAVKHLLRYNNWRHDPLSAGGYGGPTEPRSPENAIAARYDLMQNKSTRKAFGNTDAKLCSLKDCLALRFQAVSGPTADDQPPFAWRGEWGSSPHFGQPEIFNFDWVSFGAKSERAGLDSVKQSHEDDGLIVV